MSNIIKDRFTMYDDNRRPALRIGPSETKERRKRYIHLHMVITLGILFAGITFFVSFGNSVGSIRYLIFFGPAIFFLFFNTWIVYRRYGKANSSIIKIICDKDDAEIIYGKNKDTYSADKLRFHFDLGNTDHDFYHLKLYLRRPPKRRKLLFRIVGLRKHDIQLIRNFCSRNKLHYQQFASRLNRKLWIS